MLKPRPESASGYPAVFHWVAATRTGSSPGWLREKRKAAISANPNTHNPSATRGISLHRLTSQNLKAPFLLLFLLRAKPSRFAKTKNKCSLPARTDHCQPHTDHLHPPFAYGTGEGRQHPWQEFPLTSGPSPAQRRRAAGEGVGIPDGFSSSH